MNENKESKKKLKCDYNCVTCQHRNKEDFCVVKGIENCSKVAPSEFSKCNEYLIHENLVMF